MLFDHQVKQSWLASIPAVSHLDGTARLPTVSENVNPEIFLLLTEYKRISGLPLLCNTGANANGHGFFPNVASAIKCGKSNFVRSEEHVCYRKIPFLSDFHLSEISLESFKKTGLTS